MKIFKKAVKDIFKKMIIKHNLIKLLKVFPKKGNNYLQLNIILDKKIMINKNKLMKSNKRRKIKISRNYIWKIKIQ